MNLIIFHIYYSEKQASRLLQESNWSVPTAADRFFESGMVPETTSSSSSSSSSSAKKSSTTTTGNQSATKSKYPPKLETEFARFADPNDPNTMGEDQFTKFAEELSIDPYNDIIILLIAYKMECQKQHLFTKEEFIKGYQNLGIETTAQLKNKLSILRNELNDSTYFKKIWSWAYVYSCEDGQKSLSLDVVIPLTSLLINQERWPLLTDWITYLGTQDKTVNKDTWNLLYDFINKTKTTDDITNIMNSSSDFWPVQIDDFLEWRKKHKK